MGAFNDSFEILSPNTTHTDLVLKNAEYCGTPSVKRYVVLEQNHIGATMFTREADTWSEEKRHPGDSLEMPDPAGGILYWFGF